MKRTKLFLDNFKFSAVEEKIDENGIWNPVDNTYTHSGGLQINVYGNKKSYLKLSEYFKKLSEVWDNHDHCETVSLDEKTRLHFIFRAYPDGKEMEEYQAQRCTGADSP